MSAPPARITPVLSRPVDVTSIGEGFEIAVTAEPAERAALAALNGLPEVRSLHATLRLRPERRGGVRVTGEVRAEVVQTCVVTLDPFEAAVAEPVDVHLLPEAALASVRAARAALSPEALEMEDDEPDAIEGGRIDLGALTAEHLTLGLDPYPKKPGVQFAEPAPRDADPDVSPFAALKALKNNTD